MELPGVPEMPQDEEFAQFLAALISEFQQNRPRDRIYADSESLHDPTQVSALSVVVGQFIATALEIRHDPAQSNALVDAVLFRSFDDLAGFLEATEQEPPPLFVTVARETEFRIAFSDIAGRALRLKSLAENSPTSLQEGYFTFGSGGSDGPSRSAWTLWRRPPLPAPASVLQGMGFLRAGPAHGAVGESAQGVSLPEIRFSYAAYRDPAVWFGDPPLASAPQRLRGTNTRDRAGWTPDQIVARSPLAGIDVFITQKGRVTAVCDNQPLARDLINQVLAALMRGGLNQSSVSDEELIEVQGFDPNSGQIRGSVLTPLYERNERLTPGWHFTSGQLRESTCFVLPLEYAQTLLDVAAACLADDSKKVRSLRLFDSYTLLMKGHPTESFIVSWSPIEKWIQDAYETYWLQMGRSRNEIKDARGRLTAALRSDVLLAANRVDQQGFDRLAKLRGWRNGIVHELRSATRDQATECLEMAAVLCDLPSPERIVMPRFDLERS